MFDNDQLKKQDFPNFLSKYGIPRLFFAHFPS